MAQSIITEIDFGFQSPISTGKFEAFYGNDEDMIEIPTTSSFGIYEFLHREPFITNRFWITKAFLAEFRQITGLTVDNCKFYHLKLLPLLTGLAVSFHKVIINNKE